MMAEELIPRTMLEGAAERFRLLSEPVRLMILNHLNIHGEMTVQELVAATGQRQSNVSKHLGRMSQAGMVRGRRSGQHVIYRVADPTVSSLCLLVCGGIRISSADATTRV